MKKYVILVISLFITLSNYSQTKVNNEITKSWIVPVTPDRLNPSQCWFSISSSYEDNIFITGSDHKTNAAIYRLDLKNDKLLYAGDAKSASIKVNNWLQNETAEKFHNRPIYYNGKVYVATTDYSYLNDGYLFKRGFHWYAYDIASGKFIDLSVKEPDGVGGKNASLMSTALDEKKGFIYGLESPRGLLFRYDIKKGLTVNLGRPDFFTNKYYNAGRFIWCDSDGKVYYTVSGIDFVLCFDPKTGFSKKTEWTLKTKYFSDKLLRIGQWSLDGKRCYIADYEANFYLFNDENKNFTFIGQGEGDKKHYKIYRNGEAFRIRVLNVSADEKKIYFANDDAESFSLFEFDIASKKTRRLCCLYELNEKLKDLKYFNRAGHDSWDNNGRFYIASFGRELGETTDLILTRIDPVLLKVKLGIQNLIKVKIVSNKNEIILSRTGDISKELEVILKYSNKTNYGFLKPVIPSNSKSITLKLEDIIPKHFSTGDFKVTVVPDGNTYKTEK